MIQQRQSVQAMLATAIILTMSAVAFSQAPAPMRRPAYSPYLNLTRPGSAVNNYYGLVRPQQDVNNSIYGLQNQVGALNQDISNSSSSTGSPLTTGHATGFMNYSHYYSMRGRSPVGGSSMGGGFGSMPAVPNIASTNNNGSTQPPTRGSTRIPSRR